MYHAGYTAAFRTNNVYATFIASRACLLKRNISDAICSFTRENVKSTFPRNPRAILIDEDQSDLSNHVIFPIEERLKTNAARETPDAKGTM